MTEAGPRRRLLTIRLRGSMVSVEDCLRMLDIPDSARENPNGLHLSSLSEAVDQPASRIPNARAPLLGLLDSQAPIEPLYPERSESNRTPGVPAGDAEFAGGREWKLSARLNRELLAELYGAAAELSARGATVSSMVEESLRAYLPQLRRKFNRDQPFAKRGPKARSSQRQELLGTTVQENSGETQS